jgi:hypothetical protein
LLVHEQNRDRVQQRSQQEIPAKIVYLAFHFELTKIFPFLVSPLEESLASETNVFGPYTLFQ